MRLLAFNLPQMGQVIATPQVEDEQAWHLELFQPTPNGTGDCDVDSGLLLSRVRNAFNLPQMEQVIATGKALFYLLG